MVIVGECINYQWEGSCHSLLSLDHRADFIRNFFALHFTSRSVVLCVCGSFGPHMTFYYANFYTDFQVQ